MRKGKRTLILALVIILLAGYFCRTPAEIKRTVSPDNTFETIRATREETEAYRRAAMYSEKTGGLAVLILVDNKIVFEEYQNGHRAEQPAHIFSGTKTFAGVLALAAMERGKISLEESVADTIQEFRKDPLKAQIRVKHLLHFTSGIEQDFWKLSRDGMFIPADQRIKDKYAHALTMDMESAPGELYRYGSSHLMVFGEFIKRKLKQDPLDVLQERVFGPIRLRVSGWHRDSEGNAMLPYGAWLTAREWAKFGVLLLDEGRYKGKQILPADGITRMTTGSAAMPAYGLGVWLNQKVPAPRRGRLIPQLRKNAREGRVIFPDGPADLYAAAGFNGNRLYVLPSRRMLIIRMGTSNKFQDAEFLGLVVK